MTAGRGHPRVPHRPAPVPRGVVGGQATTAAPPDSGPVVCGSCRTAWRPEPRCPNCGSPFTGAERGTVRALALYAAQRADGAPAPDSVGWAAYLGQKGLLP